VRLCHACSTGGDGCAYHWPTWESSWDGTFYPWFRAVARGRQAARYMKIRFYIDHATGEPHIYGHSVTEGEVEDILASPGEDRPGREGSRVAIGQTRSGRCLRVIYVPDPGANSLFVVTALELHGKPLVAYRRRRRKKK